jgi:hypothetical protein
VHWSPFASFAEPFSLLRWPRTAPGYYEVNNVTLKTCQRRSLSTPNTFEACINVELIFRMPWQRLKEPHFPNREKTQHYRKITSCQAPTLSPQQSQFGSLQFSLNLDHCSSVAIWITAVLQVHKSTHLWIWRSCHAYVCLDVSDVSEAVDRLWLDGLQTEIPLHQHTKQSMLHM